MCCFDFETENKNMQRPEKGENWISVSFSHGTDRLT
jgi:hypothetical protein